MKDINDKIIEFLKKDARTPFLQIAKRLNVSEGTIRKRVKDLVKKGTIKKFTMETSSEAAAIIEIITNPETATDKISSSIKKLDVGTVLEVAGRFSILCHVNTKNLSEINEIVEKIRAIKGVMQTETFPILKVN